MNRKTFLKSLIAAVVLSPTICRLSNAFRFDSAAERYCDLAGVTDPMFRAAVHAFVNDLKAIGVWDKMIFLNLFPRADAPLVEFPRA
jgi:hypothetical protein